eukprot:CAMPEP_0114255982 /NCGR_PEP_ID=MMETSP0058-20121206/17883_1 /TAXON_ID=36894 /ORGANISM="Pyramimonas parkeae, CCMP726" /LENGTH=339 /DNA_ID=CAMNT_0001370465 /DNA_START=226 /DNA_END=1245 /DNA_ORIENTATION=-
MAWPKLAFGMLHAFGWIGSEALSMTRSVTGSSPKCFSEVEKFMIQRSEVPIMNSQYTGEYVKDELSLRRQLENQDCAIVGNGGSLLSEPFYGDQIDKHAIVLRMNQAPTENYTQYVGRHTSMRLLNKKWSSRYGYPRKGPKGNWGEVLPREAGVTLLATRTEEDRFKQILDILREEHSGSRVTAAQVQKDVLKLALHFERDFRACMLAETGTRFAGGHAPSSGLLGVTLLLGMCKNITLYGIGVPQTSNTSYQYYEWLGTEQDAGNPTHSFLAEKAMIEMLASHGIVSWCSSDGCSSSNHVSPTLLHLKRFEFEKLQKMEKSVQIQDSAPVTLEKPSSE